MKNETSGEAAYAPKIGELVTIRDEVDKTDKDSPLHITFRYVAAGMREGYRQARARYTPPAEGKCCGNGNFGDQHICEKQAPPAVESQELRELWCVFVKEEKLPSSWSTNEQGWAKGHEGMKEILLREVPKPQPPAEVWNEHCPVFSHDKCQDMIFKDAEGGEMSEPLAKDQRQLKASDYDASEIEPEIDIDMLLLENDKLKSQLAEHEANGLLVYGRKIECLKAELQRTRDLLGSWINKATKAHKELEKLKHGQS